MTQQNIESTGRPFSIEDMENTLRSVVCFEYAEEPDCAWRTLRSMGFSRKMLAFFGASPQEGEDADDDED